MKPNIDLTIDRDFREKQEVNRNPEITILAETHSNTPITISQDERNTGIYLGSIEEQERKKRLVTLEWEIDTSCHRCGTTIGLDNMTLLCLECDRDLEIEVLGRL